MEMSKAQENNEQLLGTPVRVLNLFSVLNCGGAETLVMNLYRHMDRSRVQFDFLVHHPECEGDYEAEIRALGGRIYRMCPIYPQNYFRYRKMLRTFFREHPEYRIVHCHISELGYLALREAARQGIENIICHAHSCNNTIDAKAPVRWYFKKRMLPYVKYPFTCSQAAGDWLYGKKNRRRFIRLNNAIDVEKYAYDPAVAEEVRRELDIPPEAFVVGSVGRIYTPKNPHEIIRVFKAVHDRMPEARLLWVGTNFMEKETLAHIRQEGLQDAVFLTGLRSDVNRLLQAMDAFILPSFFEGFPIVAVEAQAAGLPCFISDRVSEECNITGLCRFLPLGRPEQWAQNILAPQPPRRITTEQIRQAGFDMDASARWLEAFYLKLAGEKD